MYQNLFVFSSIPSRNEQKPCCIFYATLGFAKKGNPPSEPVYVLVVRTLGGGLKGVSYMDTYFLRGFAKLVLRGGFVSFRGGDEREALRP